VLDGSCCLLLGVKLI